MVSLSNKKTIVALCRILQITFFCKLIDFSPFSVSRSQAPLTQVDGPDRTVL